VSYSESTDVYRLKRILCTELLQKCWCNSRSCNTRST